MPYTFNKIVIVICEGESEKAYLQQWNQFLREYDIGLIFSTVVAGGKTAKVLLSAAKSKRSKKGDERYFLIDKDAYPNKPPALNGPILFNTQNYEDFIALHLSSEYAHQWQTVCVEQDHYHKAMAAKVYEPLFESLLDNAGITYKKGLLPSGFVCAENLKNLIINYDDKRLNVRRQVGEFAHFVLTRLIPLLREKGVDV